MKFNYPVALISINNTIFAIHYKQCVSFSFAHNSLVHENYGTPSFLH